MSYDADLAERIRDLLIDEPRVTETKMFGGLAFLVDVAAYIATHAANTHEQYAEWKGVALRVLTERNWPWPTRDSGGPRPVQR